MADQNKEQFNKKLPTVLYIVRDEGGCGFFRCYQPAKFLRRHGLMNTITDMHTTTPEHIMQADIIVFQALGTLKSVEAMNFAKSKGKKVVIEIDDFLHVVSPNNIGGYPFWNPGGLGLHRFTEQLKKADALTVATPQLAREYFPHNPNIYVLPNYLDQEKWDNPLTKKEDGYLRIGWAGGNAHIDDIKMIAPVMEKIIRKYKGKVKFENMGLTKGELTSVFKLEEFDHVCPKCDYQGDAKTFAAESLDNYPLMLATHGWDIAIAPVVNTAFNSAKSDLKLKEYSATGYPTVASMVTPYIEAKELGCNVLLAKDFKSWYNYIVELIEKPDLRRKMIKENKEWVSNYYIDQNIKHHYDVYMKILNKTNKKS